MGSVQNYLLMTGNLLPRKKVYKDALNSLQYVCDAEHGTTLTTAKRKVMKCHIDADGDVDEVWNTANYDNLATDLATVEALTFS